MGTALAVRKKEGFDNTLRCSYWLFLIFWSALTKSGLLVQNIGRIVTDVIKVSNLAQSFLSTYRLILEGVPVTNGPNYR